MENSDPRTFENVQVFAGDNFYDPANARYKNLRYERRPEGKLLMIKKEKSLPLLIFLLFLASCTIGYQARCYAIRGYNDGGVFQDKTFGECLSLCCDDPQCRSFDYQEVSAGPNCAVSSHTKEEVGTDYQKDCSYNWHYHEVGG